MGDIYRGIGVFGRYLPLSKSRREADMKWCLIDILEKNSIGGDAHFRTCDSENGGLDVKQVYSHLKSPISPFHLLYHYKISHSIRKISTPVRTHPRFIAKPVHTTQVLVKIRLLSSLHRFLITHSSSLSSFSPILEFAALGNGQQAFTPSPTPYPPSIPAPE